MSFSWEHFKVLFHFKVQFGIFIISQSSAYVTHFEKVINWFTLIHCGVVLIACDHFGASIDLTLLIHIERIIPTEIVYHTTVTQWWYSLLLFVLDGINWIILQKLREIRRIVNLLLVLRHIKKLMMRVIVLLLCNYHLSVSSWPERVNLKLADLLFGRYWVRKVLHVRAVWWFHSEKVLTTHLHCVWTRIVTPVVAEILIR